LDLSATLAKVTQAPAQVLGNAVGGLQSSMGRLTVGGVADLCVFDPEAQWSVQAQGLVSQGRHTPFEFNLSGTWLPGQVRATVVGGLLSYEQAAAA
jgi:dihydroorotase